MTTPSHPWKQTLERKAHELEEISATHRLSDAGIVRLEETVVVGCYAIRHLINGFLLPESKCRYPFEMTAFPRRQHTASQPGDARLSARYDLNAGRIAQHDPMFLCHQVLQNCILEPWLSPEHQLIGIYITSDHQRKVALYGVSLTALSELFRTLGAESVRVP